MSECEQLPRTLGYGHLEAGVVTSGMAVATPADLLAAAVAVAEPSVRGHPMFSLHSEESLVSSSADGDGDGASQTMMAIRWPVSRPTSRLRCAL